MPTCVFWANLTPSRFSHNGTGPPSLPLVAPVLQTLVRVEGTRLRPVVGLAFRGLRFTATAPTFLDDTWDTPSGGDCKR